MKSKFYTQKNSVIFSWLFSYMIILVMPIIFAVVTYIQAEKVIENEINQSNTYLLKQTQQRMDNVLKDVEKLSSEIMFNSKIQSILSQQGSLTSDQQLEMVHALNELQQFKLLNGFIDSFYIYFNNIDYVLSGFTASDSKYFYKGINNMTEEGYDSWLSTLTKEHAGEYMLAADNLKKESQGNLITYMRTFTMLGKSQSKATLVIKIKGGEFIKGAEVGGSDSERNILILDKDNNIMAQTSELPEYVHLDYSRLFDPQGIETIDFGRDKMVVSFINSQKTDWKFVTVIPANTYWIKAQNIRKFALVALFVCLLLSGALSYFLVRKNYNPLMKLITFFENKGEYKFAKKGNEYGFIESAITREADEKKRLNIQIRKQNRELKNSYLLSLLKGSEVALSTEDNIYNHEITFASDYFVVLVCYIESYENAVIQRGELDPDKTFKLAQFIIGNVLEELINTRQIGYMAETDDLLVCLVNFKNEPSLSWKEELQSAVSETQEFIYRHYKISFKVSAGDLHKTTAGIFQSYSEGIQAMQYRKVMDKKEILFYDDITRLPKGDYYYPLEKEYQLINCIKVGETNSAQQLIEEIFHKNYDSSVLPIQTTTCLMFDLASTMIKALNTIGDDGRNAFLGELGLVELVLNCRTVHEMKQKMKEVVARFCSYVEEKNKSNGLIERVRKYIISNYSDSNLGVSGIADRFAMNSAYLSREFKEKTGEGILDLINKIRIEKAKELMNNNKRNLEEIANEVGYTNFRTFMRVFVKLEGVTPGKYRGN